MRYTVEHRRLGLTALDVKIMTALNQGGSEQSFPLALKLGEKRTTVDYRLRRLARLGWIVTEVRGRRVAYVLAPEGYELVLSATSGIEFDQYATMSEVVVALCKVIMRRSQSRLYFIEPSGIAEATMVAMGEEYESLQALIKKTGRIAQGVIGSGAVKALSTKTWSTLHGRLFEMYEIDDSLLSFADIIWVADDITFLVNPNEGRFRSLADVSFARSMRALVETLTVFGKKINPHLNPAN